MQRWSSWILCLGVLASGCADRALGPNSGGENDASTTTDDSGTSGVSTSTTSTTGATTGPPPATTGTGPSATTAEPPPPPPGTSTGPMPTEDPNYPRPVDGMCPVGFSTWPEFGVDQICLPECSGAGNTCPTPMWADTPAACAVDLDASYDPCMVDSDCTLTGETCLPGPDMTQSCIGQASHCVLICSASGMEFPCPPFMVCTMLDEDAGACQYP